MSLSMYQASAPCFARALRNLSAILDKAQAHCTERRIDPLVLTGARLYPDMLPFTRQITIACDNAKGAVARLAGVENPSIGHTEKSFDEASMAEITARHFKADFNQLILDEGHLADGLRRVGPGLGEPLGDASTIPSHLLALFGEVTHH